MYVVQWKLCACRATEQAFWCIFYLQIKQCTGVYVLLCGDCLGLRAADSNCWRYWGKMSSCMYFFMSSLGRICVDLLLYCCWMLDTGFNFQSMSIILFLKEHITIMDTERNISLFSTFQNFCLLFKKLCMIKLFIILQDFSFHFLSKSQLNWIIKSYMYFFFI